MQGALASILEKHILHESNDIGEGACDGGRATKNEVVPTCCLLWNPDLHCHCLRLLLVPFATPRLGGGYPSSGGCCYERSRRNAPLAKGRLDAAHRCPTHYRITLN